MARQGQAPTDAILDGLMILTAGCLLITPGILTDVLGFSLLLPPVRFMIRSRVRDRVTSNFQQQMSGGGWTMQGSWSNGPATGEESFEDGDKIIDARVVDAKSPQIEGHEPSAADDER